MVGQSVMWAIVAVSLVGSHHHVSELGEGSSSLNHPLNHCPVHQSYNIILYAQLYEKNDIKDIIDSKNSNRNEHQNKRYPHLTHILSRKVIRSKYFHFIFLSSRPSQL